jgi:O-antigen ligase
VARRVLTATPIGTWQRVVQPRPAKHRLLVVTVATLPFSYVPHELLRSGPKTIYVQLALITACLLRYWPRHVRHSSVETAAWALAIWIILRVTWFSALEGHGLRATLAITESSRLIFGVILFRIARMDELRPAIIRGLRGALGLMLLIELYQIREGLPKLVGLGYTTPAFNYNTAAGTYRPFGTFATPVEFGIYFGLVGLAVILTSRTTKGTLLASAVTAYGLYVTYTRSAWVGVGLALLIVLITKSEIRKDWTAVVLLNALLPAIIYTLLRPDWYGNLWARIATLQEGAYSSNSIRTTLWSGVWRAGQHHLLYGYGGQSFSDVLAPIVGSDLAVLGHAHSNYLQLFYLYGLLGLFGFVALLVCFAAALSSRNYPDGYQFRPVGVSVLTAFAISSFFETTWGAFVSIATLFLLIGLGAPGQPRASVVGDPQLRLRPYQVAR